MWNDGPATLNKGLRRFLRSFLKSASALILGVGVFLFVVHLSAGRTPELEEGEIGRRAKAGAAALLARTTSKPWRGEKFETGTVGGVWRGTVNADPKTFNMILAEADGASAGIVGMMHDSLLEYDYVSRAWGPRLASAEVVVYEDEERLDVIYTLRDDLFWSFYGDETGARDVKVTSDDVVFWYDEIVGDPAFNSSGYSGQFVDDVRIGIEKLDERRFAFHFPRISADPLLATNMHFGPRFIFEAAKKQGGAEAVKALFSVAEDPRTIPSLGRWHLAEYTLSQRLVYARNPRYWEKDDAGKPAVYPERMLLSIIPDEHTEYLLFQQDAVEAVSLDPVDRVDGINKAETSKHPYEVFNAEGSLSAGMWSFNQNPVNKDKNFYRWFTQKEFRQAMSCLLNRQRIIDQVYRGLGAPKYDFFPEPNPYFNPDITLDYRYDPARALALLESIGFSRDVAGVPPAEGVAEARRAGAGGRLPPLVDDRGIPVEFDLSVISEQGMSSDIASIIVDECAAVGIRVNIRQLDFQKVVGSLMRDYDWQTVIISLGINLFPTQGSNVWPSKGNLHLWYPLQDTPATDWEARIDYLYNEASFTLDREKAGSLWDEYQRIILEQCPVVYLVRGRAFYAVHTRWDFTNLFFDNVGGLQTERVWAR